MEKLLASLGGDSTDEDLHGILEGMMGQLMSKDVLYDPLKELHENVANGSVRFEIRTTTAQVEGGVSMETYEKKLYA